MFSFVQVRQTEPTELLSGFLGYDAPQVDENEQELWLQEAAVTIAKAGAWGVDFLLAFVPYADESRLRAILLALSMAAKKLSALQRANLVEVARRLLDDKRALVVAEAVDTLSHLGCREATKSVTPLLQHPSPYVVGSALRFFSRCAPDQAVPLLEKALKADDPIVRQNAVDELAELNYTPALAKIRRLLQDPHPDVRQAARTAVAHFEDESP
jgi:HEAT repeat protein